MHGILTDYNVNEPTWFYLSFLLIVAVFFKFDRVWSLRNIDLALLLSIAPGLLLVGRGTLDPDSTLPNYGYVWLFFTAALCLVRMLIDGTLKRRPQLGQNLNSAGLSFLCLAAFAFLMTRAVTGPLSTSTVESIRRADQMLNMENIPPEAELEQEAGPANALMGTPGAIAKDVIDESGGDGERLAAAVMAIFAHFAVVTGLLALAWLHFGNLESGWAMIGLYLLLPCTAYDVGDVIHVLPPAMIVWALVAYRRPLVSGMLMGLACGTLIFPVFLLPLWMAFYGRRGALRFFSALAMVALLLLGTLALTSVDTQSFLQKTLWQLDLGKGLLTSSALDGFWEDRMVAYRIPVIVTFVVMVASMTIWPREKNLAHLMSHSAAIVIGTQFWYPHEGGVYVLWYLPLMLAVMFRSPLTKQLPPELTPLKWFRKTPSRNRESIKTTSSVVGNTKTLAGATAPRSFFR